MPLFQPQTANVKCPNCGNPMPVRVHSIVDAGHDPDLKARLLNGQLNVGQCPGCGAGGQLAVPLLYHDPAKEFLAVYFPSETHVRESERQKVIGEMTNALMSRLPSEQRRGYMLQPKQFINSQSFYEAILEQDGITKEMLEAQREKVRLLERLLRVAEDRGALEAIVQENRQHIDGEFLYLLSSIAPRGQGDAEKVQQQLENVYDVIQETTEIGRKVKRQQELVEKLQEKPSRSTLLDMVIQEDEETVDLLATVFRPLADYVFFQRLTERIDELEKNGNADEAKRLGKLRDRILNRVTEVDREAEATIRSAQGLLQEILGEPDLEAAVRQRAERLDDVFFNVLNASIQQMQQSGSKAAAERLRQVWEACMNLMEEQMPPPVRLINRALAAEHPGGTRKVLEEHRHLLTPELLQMMDELSERLRSEGREEVAKRLRNVRAQAAMMQ